MSARRISPSSDPIGAGADKPVRITLDGASYTGTSGQTVAGVLLGSGCLSWRTTSVSGRPRGVFCGIGVCFDCIATVNGIRDVRLCQRRAADGDVVESQNDALPTVSGGEDD